MSAVNAPAGNADTEGMRAFSIRQAYAELVLRGIKTVELRSRSTRIVRERFYIYYASKGSGVRVQGSGEDGILPTAASNWAIVR